MTTSHTPGPWTVIVDGLDGEYDIYPERLQGSEMIARVWGKRPDGNARLIAAAPELLGACLRLQREMIQLDVPPAIFDYIHAAIAKATGSQP